MRLLDDARERALDDLERIEEETGEKNHTLLSDDDLEIDWSEVPENEINREDVTPENFGRIAAQTAKQVILQRIREAEREMMYDEYIDRVGEVVTGIVQQTGDRRNILVDLGKVEALLPGPEQVDGERYEQGSRIKAVIREVRTGTKGPQVILSRRDPELIKTLFELEVPEIADGLVTIEGVAREPGYRSKIAVQSHTQGVDPVGACVGPRGSRVRMVVSELRGEKIDIIPWNNEPARFVAKALSPARVREVYLDDAGKEATVVVPDDQLALAIGKEGMNARLAARLTGWKIDITSDSEFAQQEADAAFGGGEPGDENDVSGRCAAVLTERQALPERVAARLEVLRRAGSPGAGAARDRRRGQPDRRRVRARARGALRHRRARARHRGRGRVRQSRAGDHPRRPRRRTGRRARRDARPPAPTTSTISTSKTTRSAASRSRRSRRRTRRPSSGEPRPDLRRLRPQGAAGRAPALPLRSAASSSPAQGRDGARTPAGGCSASSAQPRGTRSTGSSGARCASTLKSTCLYTGSEKWQTASRIDPSDRAAVAPRGGAASSSTRAADAPVRVSVRVPATGPRTAAPASPARSSHRPAPRPSSPASRCATSRRRSVSRCRRSSSS